MDTFQTSTDQAAPARGRERKQQMTVVPTFERAFNLDTCIISVFLRKDSVHPKTVSSSPRVGKCNLATFSSSSFPEEIDGPMLPIMLKICELGLEEVSGDERDQHQPEDNF